MREKNTNLSYIKYIKRGIKLNANIVPSHIGKTQLHVDFNKITLNLYNNLKVGEIAYMLPSSLKRGNVADAEYFIKYLEKCLKQKTNKLHCKKVLISDKYLILHYYNDIFSEGFVVTPKIKAIPLIGNKEINTKFFLPNMFFLTEEDYQRYIIATAKGWLYTLSKVNTTYFSMNQLTYYNKILNEFIERFKIT